MTVREIYDGSNGDDTRALYAQLEQLGPVGVVALNLFRASKNSARAKVYRGGIRGQGSYRRMAYDRKNWALEQLAAVLVRHSDELGIRWGWQLDERAAAEGSPHRYIMYVDIPTRTIEQVSFHAQHRGLGPEYGGEWDGVRNASANRIIAFCAQLLAGVAQ
jgi:hypothetical protein